MFCRSYYSEEHQAIQYCRAFGTYLRPVRVNLERLDSITASAVSAREEIGRAVAEKIRDVQDARELKQVADHVLPQIEKFLESPKEKRLRRMRAGVITAASGLGTSAVGLLLASGIYGYGGQNLTGGGAGLGILMFLGGLGLILNAMRFTGPGKAVDDDLYQAESQNLIEPAYGSPQLKSGESPSFRSPTTSNLAQTPGPSITEHTTKHLKTGL